MSEVVLYSASFSVLALENATPTFTENISFKNIAAPPPTPNPLPVLLTS